MIMMTQAPCINTTVHPRVPVSHDMAWERSASIDDDNLVRIHV